MVTRESLTIARGRLRAWRERRSIVGAFALVVAAFAVAATVASYRTSQNTARIGRIQTALYMVSSGDCERSNIKTRQSNRSALADYTFFVAILKRAEIVAPSEPAKVRAAGAPYLALLKASVRAKSWVPLTDCRAAVNESGLTYTAPGPVAFDVRLPPARAISPN